MTEVLLESVGQDLHAIWQMLPRLVAGLLVLLVFAWIGRVLGRAIADFARRAGRTQSYDRFLRHLVTSVFALIGLTLALQIAGLGQIAVGMLAAGGVVAVVFGFAFREIGENLLAGLFLSFSRSFEIGDLIQSGDWTGEVKQIELRQIHIRTADGRDIFIPCARVYGNALVNFTKDGLRAPRFTVGIDYADDAQKAREVLLRAVAGTTGVLSEPPPMVVISELAPQYVELTVTFWSDTFQQGLELLNVKSDVMDNCRRALREAGFTLSNDVSSAQAVTAVGPIEVTVESR